MQFFYQFPQRTERMVLISSGGLGREVRPAPAHRDASRRGGSPVARDASARLLAALRASGDRLRSPAHARASICRRSRARCARWNARGARKAFLEHPAGGDQSPGTAGERAGPSVPACRHAHADRVGRARRHDPGETRIERASRRPRKPLRDAAACSPLPPPGRSRGTGARLLADFLAGTDPARIEDEDRDGIVLPHAPRSRHEVRSSA